jgi:hypothetical protein
MAAEGQRHPGRFLARKHPTAGCHMVSRKFHRFKHSSMINSAETKSVMGTPMNLHLRAEVQASRFSVEMQLV